MRNLQERIKNERRTKKIFGVNSNPELEQLIADRYILEGLLRKAVNRRSAYQNGIVLQADRSRSTDFNIRNWAQLTDEEKQGIIDEYTKLAEE